MYKNCWTYSNIDSYFDEKNVASSDINMELYPHYRAVFPYPSGVRYHHGLAAAK